MVSARTALYRGSSAVRTVLTMTDRTAMRTMRTVAVVSQAIKTMTVIGGWLKTLMKNKRRYAKWNLMSQMYSLY